MHLLGIPTEILLQVFGYVGGLPDRANLSRGCRRLYELIRSILYSEFAVSFSMGISLCSTYIRKVDSMQTMLLRYKKGIKCSNSVPIHTNHHPKSFPRAIRQASRACNITYGLQLSCTL